MEITYRGLKQSDLNGMLHFINTLADEDTYISTGRQTKAKEKKWLDAQLKKIRKKDLAMVVAECDGRIAGSCGIERESSFRSKHVGLLSISVAKEFRGKGIGTELMRRAIVQAKERLGLKLIILEVFSNNARARRLYKKMGFKEHGRCPKKFVYKGRYVDDILMHKWIG